MKEKQEFRYTTLKEVRVDQTDGKRTIEGYAALFNTPTDLGGFREVIIPGAFSRALKEQQDVRALINHDPNMVLGRTASGTLELTQDEKGLKFRVQMPDTTYAHDLMESMSRGDINQCSFGFMAVDQNWTDSMANPAYADADDNGQRVVVRELKDMDLLDVSPVTYPAYPETSVGLRSLLNLYTEVREKTKSVDGEEHPASDFAYVGDPNDTSTWKLPIFDADHVRNALARFSHTEGIPADEKDKVYAKIVAAAKKFGIHVSEENSVDAFNPDMERMKMQLELAKLRILGQSRK